MPEDDGKYDVISVRPDQEIKPKIAELQQLILKQTGMRVSAGDAVAVAVIEAIKSRSGE